jgi:hypothetical protein
MQAVALVTGDEFLVPFNLTIDTNDVLEYMENLLLVWDLGGFIKMANFDDFYGVDFALIVGPSGFCYNFNMIDADELFNLDM